MKFAMEKLRSNDVFKPGAFPEYTYISRVSSELKYSYEIRLQQALNTAGYLTSIIGPSKTGKTVLCEKVIGKHQLISLSGSDFKKSYDFWVVVSRKVGLSLEGEHTESNSYEGQGITSNTEKKSVTIKEKYVSSKDRVIDYFKENNLVLVLDDFHYAPEDLQFDIAYQLKDAIRKEFKAIVISLPHRADDAIRKNADLSGRLSLINIEPWQEYELKEIATTGFNKLGVNISDEFASKIALESLTSPQLMQSICLNLSTLLNIDNDSVNQVLNESIIKESYGFTTINLPYKEVVKKLKEGPSTRGQKRKKYELINGENADVYSILLKSIAENPPLISISLEEIKNRVDRLIKNSRDKLDKNKIRDSLQKLQDIMMTSASIYQVFEWKDNQVYILDPLFLFYLRWGVC
ncbi:ATP-binding protein [Clostridium sp. ZS2-4]|uniref:ATP-binding protein n=1 Tax=Clostridium sp. ZS2-4 TaxID=2987703 RepID=UPI00227C3BE6|nr:ATP-binding protein [Clostridium sp. ZS2-4]MCY6355289.1 ATP-binding protein [Clostridium sp. ZS2-4]